MSMSLIGISTLLNKKARIIGFCYGTHPESTGWYDSIVFYRVDDGWVLCTTQGPKPFNVRRHRRDMGKTFPGSRIAHNAKRHIGGNLPFAEWQKDLEESLRKIIPDLQFEWEKKS